MVNANQINVSTWRRKLSFPILIPIWFLTFTSPFFVGEPFSLSSFIFDFTLLLLLIASARYKLNKHKLLVLVFALVYFVISFLLLDKNYSSIRDFLIIYKSVLYLAIISLISGSGTIKHKHLLFIYRTWTIFFLCIYAIERFTSLSSFGRPDVFIENNFEIAALCIMHLALFPFLGSERNIYQLTLIIISFLSGSFSGVVTVAIITVILNAALTPRKIALFSMLSLLAAVPILSVLEARLANGFESIDRVVFLQRFLYEIREWGIVNYMFGTFPVTPLSASTCNALSFYKNLFSRTDPDTCYSVVLHSYILRVIYDHGIFGFTLLLTGISMCLKELPMRIRLAILSVLILNALSVSSFNSSVIAVAIALSCARRFSPSSASNLT